MSIFDRTSLMESVDDVEFYDGYMASIMESVAEINAELNENTYKLTTSLYIADLLLEQKAQAGEDIEALVEAAIGDFASKIIDSIKTTQTKTALAFKRLIKKLQMDNITNKAFMKRYEKSILNLIRDTKNDDLKWAEYDEYADYDTLKKFIEGIPAKIKSFTRAQSANHGNPNFYRDAADKAVSICISGIPNATTYHSAMVELNKINQCFPTNKRVVFDSVAITKTIKRVNEYFDKGVKLVCATAKEMETLCNEYMRSVKQIQKDLARSDKKNKPLMKDVRKYCSEMSKGIRFLRTASLSSVSAYNRQHNVDMDLLRYFVKINLKLIVT